MKIDIQKLREQPIAYEVNLGPTYLGEDAEPGMRFTAARGTVVFTLDEKRILAEGHLQTTVHMPCARCLAEATVALDVPIHLYYWPEQTRRDRSAIDIDVEEPDYALYSGDSLDPDEELREVVLVEVPRFALCREDCKGLCPECGKNLNEGACACVGQNDSQTTDPSEPDWKRKLRGLKPPSDK